LLPFLNPLGRFSYDSPRDLGRQDPFIHTAHGPRTRRDLLDILCCPVCKGDLALAVIEEAEEILKGSLTCGSCKNVYSIEDGIPDLLPPGFK